MKVQLIGHYGSDEIIACSAWTSTSRELTQEKRDRIPDLLMRLAKQGHHTPFEKSALHFLVRTDIATHIHLLKHRIGVSINAESARYKELTDDTSHSPIDWPVEWELELLAHCNESNRLYHQALKELTPILGRKRAKESARYFKPYASEIEADIMFNWRSFVHFLRLRNTEDAQFEIRVLASNMLDQVKEIVGNPFKATIEAFDL